MKYIQEKINAVDRQRCLAKWYRCVETLQKVSMKIE